MNRVELANDNYIIVANHRTKLDPFILSAALGPKNLLRLNSIHYMTSNIYLKKIYGPLLKILGAFPANKTPTSSKYGIEKSTELLGVGRTVMIFPEGKIIRNDNVTRIRNGARVVARQTGKQIIPMLIEDTAGKNLPIGLRIYIGKPFSAKDNLTPEQLMSHIYSLRDE